MKIPLLDCIAFMTMNMAARLPGIKTAGILLLVFCGTAALAASPEKISGVINFANDYANVLSPAELHELEQRLIDISHNNQYEIGAVIHKQVPQGVAPEDASEIADRLMIGSTLEDRGIVVLVFVQERSVHVEVGYGLEGLIPDAVAHRVATAAAAHFAKGDYAGGLLEAIATLSNHADAAVRIVKAEKKSRWRWLPDWMLAIGDASRGFAFFAAHRHEIPKQLAIWWKGKDVESRQVLGAFFAGGAVWLLVLLRPALGAILGLVLPLACQSTRAMRWLFFFGTGSCFEREWKVSGARGMSVSRAVYIADALYYGFGAVLLVGIVMSMFIVFVGHPGSFGGAGARAVW